MKRTIISANIAFIIFAAACIPCFAAVGDIKGNVYATDIRAFVNGIKVEAYNIGGRTCIPIEDVTSGYEYNNDVRTLLVYSFRPEILKEYDEGEGAEYAEVGAVLGSVYETDIKTYFYDMELPSYNIGGKTCVAIEDIGDDNTFSRIGGKYIWDPVNRTISLEYLYDIGADILDLQIEFGYNIVIKDGVLEFVPSVDGYVITTDLSGLFDYMSERPKKPIPIRIGSGENETIVGYNQGGDTYHFYYDASGKCRIEKVAYSFNYLYADRIREAMKIKGPAKLERDDVLKLLLDSMMADVKERYDTDRYTYVLFNQPTPHGTNTVMLCVWNDGSYKNISGSIPGTLQAGSSSLDRENDRVSFKLVGNSEVYTFDLVTGEFVK
jgi:hypothetical protein